MGVGLMTTSRKISVASRAHRALRNIPRFHFGSTIVVGLKGEYGDLVGVYENPEGIEPRQVVVTEAAIGCFDSATSRWILFDHIDTTKGPNDKSVDDSIRVVLKSGVQTEIRIAGGDGRFKDVFGFVRFINRVLEDRRSAD